MALNEVSSIATRLKELTVQKDNGTLSTEDIGAIELEMEALAEEIENITTGTKFNGIDVFGSDVTMRVGDDSTQTIDLSAATIDLVKGLSKDSTSADVDAAIVQLNTQRATYGAVQNRLEHNMNNLTTTHENLTAAESRIRDTDMAKEMVEELQ